MKISRITRLKRQLKRDTANATIDATIRVTMTAGIATISVLRKCWAKSPPFQASMKFWKFRVCGSEMYPAACVSEYGRRAV